MALSAGTKLGPYEIQSPLGAGGMGEVYRARDTRLERTVAIKILPSHLSNDAEAKQRFDREAHAISSLNHANICTLHDVGHQDGVDYLVMEFLEGESLADRLMKGPLPTEQVLRYGAEICEGLERAHKTGVIHRDLKPGNVMLTKSGAKLMDFGLAKSAVAAVTASSLSGVTFAPDKPLTSAGTVVGTFQYMSPEQVEGKEADARSDIFALGAVLYEMATGKRAFEGKTTASVIAAVLERDPEPISAVRPMSPPALDRLVKACVAKDPDERIQTVHDVKLQLKWIADGGSQTGIPITVAKQRKTRERLAWALFALALLCAVGLAIFHFNNRKPERLLVAQITLPPGLSFSAQGDSSGTPVISPDGNHLIFGAVGGGGSRLYIRALNNLTVTPLPGTDGATFPFWSPDSRSIAFFSGDKLKRMEIASGSPTVICDAASGRGGSWGKDGTIVFAPSLSAGISKVAASGGAPVEIVKLDTPRYTTYRWPWLLPDGKHFLYLALNHAAPTGSDSRVFIASLDGNDKENRPLLQSLSNAVYASGQLLYVRGSTLMAQPFDAASLRLTGDATALTDSAHLDMTIWRGSMSASGNGVLSYLAGSVGSMTAKWMDRAGKDLGSIGTSESFWQVALSPGLSSDKTQKKLVFVSANSGDMFSYDSARKVGVRLSFGPAERYTDPVWSADGSQIAYTRQNSTTGVTGIYVRAASGAGQETELLAPVAGTYLALCDWSRDGRYIVFLKDSHVWILPLFGDRKPYLYMPAPVSQGVAQFSPDGRWIAYSSAESGGLQIYVAPFPATGAKWQISSQGGDVPLWREDGKELFFLSDNPGAVMATEVHANGNSFEAGELRTLFRANLEQGYQGMRFAVSKDGQRFLVISGGDQAAAPLVLMENWTEKLKK